MTRLVRPQPVDGYRGWVGVLPLLALLTLLTGCTQFRSESPPLPDSTFTKVLTELHVTMARHELDAPVPRGLRDSVFAHYDVDPATFDSTLKYYGRRPVAFKALYQPIIDTLQALQYKGGPKTVPEPGNASGEK